ncbi:MAG: cysteine synthase A [Acetobacteraceae bacterium]
MRPDFANRRTLPRGAQTVLSCAASHDVLRTKGAPPMKANNVLETIGSTPHIRLSRLFPDAEVWVKSERDNPGGSIKDRIALAMVEAAEQDGSLKPGGIIVEPTSGNTGIGLAMVAAVKGYKLILVMPDSMSVERRRLMQAYGATFDLTPREGGMKRAIARATELVAQNPGAWMPQQFENPANIDVHVRTTAQEILADFPEGLDALITGVGTGGHITGCAQVLKPLWPQLKVFAVEPTASAVLSGGSPAPHPIQGIGAGFVPLNLHTALLDGVIQIEADEAREYGRRSAREEGLLVGISSGATLAAIAKKLPELPKGARVLGFNYDTGERYLSVPEFLPS